MADLQTSLLSQDPMAKTSKLAELAHRPFCHGATADARWRASWIPLSCVSKSSSIFSACHGRHERPAARSITPGRPAGTRGATTSIQRAWQPSIGAGPRPGEVDLTCCCRCRTRRTRPWSSVSNAWRHHRDSLVQSCHSAGTPTAPAGVRDRWHVLRLHNRTPLNLEGA